jgi:hypothetical protein
VNRSIGQVRGFADLQLAGAEALALDAAALELCTTGFTLVHTEPSKVIRIYFTIY